MNDALKLKWREEDLRGALERYKVLAERLKKQGFTVKEFELLEKKEEDEGENISR